METNTHQKCRSYQNVEAGHYIYYTEEEEGKTGRDRLAGKAATLTSILRLGRSEVLRNSRHYRLRAQSQAHRATGRLRTEAWKEEALDDPPLKLKGRERALSIRPALELAASVKGGNVGDPSKGRGGVNNMSFSEGMNTIFNR